MMKNNRNQKIFFWSVILVCLLLSVAQVPTASTQTASSDLIINEFIAINGTGLTDEEGEYSDWIEIYNRGNTAINLAGWALTDDPEQPQKWPFPDVTLGSHTYLVVFASGKDRRATGPGAVLHTNFKLDREGDFLALHNALEDRLMDALAPKFPEQFRDISYGLHGDESGYGYLALPTPGGPNDETHFWTGVVSPVEFSAKRGFYEQPFTLKLMSATPAATIRYTIDGSEPTESNGALYTEPISIEATTLLRAVAFKPNALPSPVETQSYIFLDNVLTQPASPAGFPLSWGARLTTDSKGHTSVAPVAADYEMDPRVVNDPGYQDAIEEDLKSLPVMSLVMPGQSFAGLHSHLGQSESNEEHPVSIELIYPAGDQPGFQINAGIELQDEAEPGRLDSKHSFRLLFKRKYGPTKLDYPLFPESPADEFDTLVLQAGALSEPTTYTRDAWLHNSQMAMSGLGSSTLPVHLYLNGLYWGVYNLVERPDASFMAVYYGGEKEGWFVANQNGPLNQDLGSNAGQLDYLFTTLSLAGRFGDAPELEEELAEKYTELASYLDPVQFSDTMILNWYSQLLGWPENKWHLAIPRQEPWGQGQYFIWNEQEISNQAAQISSGGTETPPFNLINPVFETLLQNPDFRMHLADRMYKHLANDGSLTDANAEARWQRLSDTIDQAMVGESARWGDASQEAPLTQADWLRANDIVLDQLEGHAAKLIAWGREVGYYPALDPPLFSQEGGLVKAGFTLTMTPPAGLVKGSIIYYTTDSSDPRMPVTGEVAPSAIVYNGPVSLATNTQIKARILAGGSSSTNSEKVWSALHEATFNVMQQNHALRITEIMYNPAEGDDYEFIELRNVGSNAVDLANVSIDEGVSFAFPSNTPPLAPGGTVVLVSNPTAFAERYPHVTIGGAYEGHLSNKGEKILMTDAVGEPLIEFAYDDANSWPVSADGRGDSLVLIEPDGDPNDPRNWQASANLNGSPGTDETMTGASQPKG